MSALIEFLVTVAVLAAAGLGLALTWTAVQRKMGTQEVRRPREDPDVQLHQATSRSQINP